MKYACGILTFFVPLHCLILAVFVTLLWLQGPAENLFQESYYQLMKYALREGGILGAQG